MALGARRSAQDASFHVGGTQNWVQEPDDESEVEYTDNKNTLPSQGAD